MEGWVVANQSMFTPQFINNITIPPPDLTIRQEPFARDSSYVIYGFADIRISPTSTEKKKNVAMFTQLRAQPGQLVTNIW